MTKRWKSAESYNTMPLVEVSIEHGTHGLEKRLQNTLERIGLGDNQLIQYSIKLCKSLHKDDKRTYEPFVNHPLRVALRLVEELNITDPDMLIAALLHDTVEDHSRELVERHHTTEPIPDDPHKLRKYGLQALAAYTNSQVATIVRWMSNPVLGPEDDKNHAYIEHTRLLTTQGSPKARAIKLVDFEDNTLVPKGREDPLKRRRLDEKQLGAYVLHARSLCLVDSMVKGKARQEASMMLLEGYLQASERLGHSRAAPTDQDSLRTA